MGPETERLLLVAREALETYLERRLQTEGALEAIARILEGLDYETEGHMRRVSRLAVLLGERAGVEDLEGLRMGAYLHDLGKLFLPREVLDKPGPLNTVEWTQVRTHPEMGHEVLSRIPFLPKTTLEVVLYHHEHWDGTGYPKGLKGRRFPFPPGSLPWWMCGMPFSPRGPTNPPSPRTRPGLNSSPWRARSWTRGWWRCFCRWRGWTVKPTPPRGVGLAQPGQRRHTTWTALTV